ncbi:MAG: NAD-dependent malic enzyme [Gammaproteobacteria bacterium]|nr:NAD-dependent malic enzyme [Gammaproteobacteria bacterium]
MSDDLRGMDLLQDATRNKGSAFTLEERSKYGLRGLLPAAVSTQEMQMTRALGNIRRKAYDIERYIFLRALQVRNERLYFQLIINNIEELMPIIYTPTVGQACKEYSHIFRQPRGLFITADDHGDIRELLNNWPERDVRMIVVTDGERILGLGDLGVNGMGIPLGKLALYTACAGIQPHQCLPVTIDIGTNNESLHEGPLYLGVRQKRITGNAYFELLDEFVVSVQEVFPGSLIQFEDFATQNAYRLLNTWKERVLCFNDDIQGTAAVVLAGVLAATKITGQPLNELKFMFLGAGSAATGIADLICVALCSLGLTAREARQRLWFVDHRGLLVKGREHLAPHNTLYAHEHPGMGFVEAIKTIKPQVLIGATGSPGTFTREALQAMADINKRPAIFALSNPTSRAECTAEQAYLYTDGRAIFASGSPFDPVTIGGRTYRPGQGNNAYIFPGMGLGAIACSAQGICDEMLIAAAHVLAGEVSEQDLADGSLYPALSGIRDISLKIAVAVAKTAFDQGLVPAGQGIVSEDEIAAMMYDPGY